MMLWIGLHKFANAIFEITLKPLYITSSNLVAFDNFVKDANYF